MKKGEENTGYLFLGLAIIFEVAATTFLKMSSGFSVLLPSIGTIFGYIFCFIFLSFVLKTMEMSFAYAVWCALGILFVSIVGIFFFNESINILKIVSILFIILGTAGLKLAG